MAEKRLKPAIRFNGYGDAWELRKAKDLFTSTADKGHPELPVLSATQDRGMIKRDDNGINIFHDKKNEEGYKRVVPGQFVIHLRSFQGGFAHSAIEGITSPAYTVFGFQEPKNHDDNYWKYIFSSKEFIRRLETVTYGIRDGRSISYDEFLTMVFSYPQKEEQARIAAFLDKTTDLITLHQRKYDKLVNIKKSMLEKMFPQNGSNSPEIRFAGFTDAWELRKLGELALSFEYGLNAAAMEYDGVNKYLRITDIDDETHEFKTDALTTPDVDLTTADNYRLKEGDVLFARTGASVGKTYRYKGLDGLVYFAGFLIRARIKPECDAEFVFQNTLTDSYNRYITITSQRSGQPGVNAQEYAEFELTVPGLAEQRKIGSLFHILDNLITLHQRELEKLQNIKKSMLEKMFV